MSLGAGVTSVASSCRLLCSAAVSKVSPGRRRAARHVSHAARGVRSSVHSAKAVPADDARVDEHHGPSYIVVEAPRHADTPSTSVDAAEDQPQAAGGGTRTRVLATVLSVGGLLLLIGAGIYYAEPIKDFLNYFATVVDDWGPLGVLAYFGVYTLLEVLALPAIPLTMTAGAIFGIIPGTLITSLAGTLAATIAFLIARYVARDKFKAWANKNKRFRAIDKVIAKNGFKVVTLLRLSPLFPLAVSNYLYGLTSVELPAYFFGSWVGMIPGTLAYVSAGHVSKVALVNGGELPLQWWQIALAVGVSVFAIGYIGTLAKKELADIDGDATGSMTDSLDAHSH